MKKLVFLAVILALLAILTVGMTSVVMASNGDAGQVTPTGLWNQFKGLVDGPKLAAILALVTVNFLLGIAAGIYTNTFRLKKLGGFLLTRVLPYLLSYYALGVAVLVDISYKPYLTGTYVVIMCTLIGCILANLRELGLPVPETLGGEPDIVVTTLEQAEPVTQGGTSTSPSKA